MDVGVVGYVVLALAALVIGVSKTSVSGAASLAVVVFAIVLPAKESTGTILPLLVTGDLVAVSLYRSHADWGIVRRLLPWMLVGLIAGVGFLAVADDTVVRRTIGALLLVFLLVPWLGGALGLAGPTGSDRSPARHPIGAALAGAAAGFSTMTANAAGPVMAIYLVLMRVQKMVFLGSNAWLFLIINVIKLPFSGALGLIDGASLMLDLTLVPWVLAGCAIGTRLIGRLHQSQFERITLVLAAVSAFVLLVT